MLIAFNAIVGIRALGPDNFSPLVFLPGRDIFDYLPPLGAGIFALQILIHAAFINIYALIFRNSVQPLYKFQALYFRFFTIGKGLFFKVIFIFCSI